MPRAVRCVHSMPRAARPGGGYRRAVQKFRSLARLGTVDGTNVHGYGSSDRSQTGTDAEGYFLCNFRGLSNGSRRTDVQTAGARRVVAGRACSRANSGSGQVSNSVRRYLARRTPASLGQRTYGWRAFLVCECASSLHRLGTSAPVLGALPGAACECLRMPSDDTEAYSMGSGAVTGTDGTDWHEWQRVTARHRRRTGTRGTRLGSSNTGVCSPRDLCTADVGGQRCMRRDDETMRRNDEQEERRHNNPAIRVRERVRRAHCATRSQERFPDVIPGMSTHNQSGLCPAREGQKGWKPA